MRWLGKPSRQPDAGPRSGGHYRAAVSSALLVLAPILAPMAISYGVDPVHFGLIIPRLLWFVLTVFGALMVITFIQAFKLAPVELIFGG